MKATQSVFIPKEGKGDDALFIAVNGRRMLVKKGEAVELPSAFAEVVRNSMKQQKEAEAYISANSKY